MTSVGSSVVGLGEGLKVGLNVTGGKVDSIGEGDGGSVTWNEIFGCLSLEWGREHGKRIVILQLIRYLLVDLLAQGLTAIE